jgi:1,4-dihydroxy-2-naphthoyl-CoA hydrolase
MSVGESNSSPPSAADPYTLEPGTFVGVVGCVFDPVVPAGLDTVVTGKLDVDERHQTPWGVVHGGVWATVIESAASIGASVVVAERGQFAVGVDNVTDFLRPIRTGHVDVVATAAQIGRSLQLWQVELTDAAGKTVARGRVRLSNQPLRS